CTQEGDDANHGVGPLAEKGQEFSAAEEEQLRRLTGYRRCTAAFAVQQGDFAEELAGAMPVENEFLALRRLDDNEDASRHAHIEAIARVVLAKHELTRGDAFDDRPFHQLRCFGVRQGAENGMQAKQVLGCHAVIMSWAPVKFATLESSIPWPV